VLAAGILAGCSKTQPDPGVPGGGAGRAGLLKVSLKLDWYPTPEHGGFYQALVKGYYRDAGLDVTIVPGGPGAYPLPYVGTGRADLGIGRLDDLILGVREGLPLVAVFAQMEHDPQAIMVHEESPVRSFKDLDGLTVMANPGTNWTAFIEKRYNIHFNQIPMTYGLGMFLARRDLVQQCYISSEPFVAEQQGVKTRVLLISNAGYDPYRIVFANRAFVRDHPDAIRAFAAATARGYREYLGGRGADASAMILAEDAQVTPALTSYTIAALNKYRLVAGDPAKGEGIGLLTAERCRQLDQTLADLKVLDAPLPLPDFVTFEFLPQGAAAPGR
jgi:NitT/TauT family transport system substrate-binding protein